MYILFERRGGPSGSGSARFSHGAQSRGSSRARHARRASWRSKMSLIKRAGSAERNISTRVLTHTRGQRIMTRGRMNSHGSWTLFLERDALGRAHELFHTPKALLAYQIRLWEATQKGDSRLEKAYNAHSERMWP